MPQVVGTIETAPEAVGTGYRGPNEVPTRLHREDSAMEQSSPLYAITRTGNRRRLRKPHPALLAKVRSRVMIRDDFTCQSCGVKASGDNSYDGRYAPPLRVRGRGGWMELDHVVRYRDGGEFAVDNLRAMCPRCNSRRG